MATRDLYDWIFLGTFVTLAISFSAWAIVAAIVTRRERPVIRRNR